MREAKAKHEIPIPRRFDCSHRKAKKWITREKIQHYHTIIVIVIVNFSCH